MTPTPSTPPFATTAPIAGDTLADAMQVHLRRLLQAQGGWIGFDTFMEQALYAPGLGYYSRGSTVFGVLPQGQRSAAGETKGAGSDFVTAPEMTPLFGQALARQIAQALQVTGTDEIWEFGAGTGALALQILDALDALGVPLRRYTIVDLSQPLKARQQATLQAHAHRVQWAVTLPAQMQGVVVGNEVLDAMPVKLLARLQGVWHERGVVWDADRAGFAWQDRPTELRPPDDVAGQHDYVTEIHPQGEAFVRTLADRLQAGAIFLLDYGFPEHEYYHEQRHMGTVMCHRAHQSDDNPLPDVGLKDITAHVNFTAMALAAQDQPLPPDQAWSVLGYTTQAHFLINCGLLPKMELEPLAGRALAAKLIMEHEMGELFKVLAVGAGEPWEPLGFSHGDRSHRL